MALIDRRRRSRPPQWLPGSQPPWGKEGAVMTEPTDVAAPSDGRRSRAMRLAVASYFGQLRADWRVSVPALVLPGLGSILTVYLPPLVVSSVITRLVKADGLELRDVVPAILLFAGAWL